MGYARGHEFPGGARCKINNYFTAVKRKKIFPEVSYNRKLICDNSGALFLKGRHCPYAWRCEGLG